MCVLVAWVKALNSKWSTMMMDMPWEWSPRLTSKDHVHFGCMVHGIEHLLVPRPCVLEMRALRWACSSPHLTRESSVKDV
jgi:hypothetical protein